ncbi:chemotaxis protein CheW [Marinomonas balearica]|nr:chemotaxis protein CheW [Marinomonas balearica]
MKDIKNQEQELVGPQKALQKYLDDLLQDATEPTTSSEVLVEESTVEVEEAMPSLSAEASKDEEFQEDVLEEGSHDKESEITEESQRIDQQDEFDRLDLSFADFEAAIQPLQQEYESVAQQGASTATVEENELSLGLTIGTSELLSADHLVDEDELSKKVLEEEPPEEVEEQLQESELQEDVSSVSYDSDIADEESDNTELSTDVTVADIETEVVLDNELSVASTPILEGNVATESAMFDESHTADIADTDEEIHLEPKKQIAPTDPLPWAQSRFECLLFHVGKLKLAVPLVELGGIHQGDDEKLTAIFGQPSWFLGMSNVGEFNLRTVDTAKWVMPDHYEGELKESFKFVIQLDRSDWGLACELVAEAISLEPSEVKWRSDRSRRPWLAGTVIDHMCAILDVQGFITLLEDPENGFRKHLKHVD